MGAGPRLIPMVVGVAVGAGLADRVATRAGAKLTVVVGFLVLAAGAGLAATTSLASGDALAATWMATMGLGTGLALATSASAALGTLSAEGAGVGSAVTQVFQRIGAPIAAAFMGSVLNDTYRSTIDLTGLPAQAAETARNSVFAGLQIAQQLGSSSLLDSVRTAFVNGMDGAFLVAAGGALVGGVLALAFLPQRAMAVERPSLAVVTKLHRGLADEARLAILLELREGPRTAGQVAASVGLSASDAADRLQCLVDCALVRREHDGPDAAFRLIDPSVGRLLEASVQTLGRVGPTIEACPNYERPLGRPALIAEG